MQQPYLSIVLTSRNDNYSGGIQRLQICVDSLLEQARRHQLELELILVDWNTPQDAAPLKDAINWSQADDQATVRVIEVPCSIHQQLPFADKVPFLAHTARNVGIRRAKGKFVLVTAMDILFSESLIALFAAKQLDEKKNYRVSRYDVPERALQISALQERLKFCEENTFHSYQRPHRSILPELPLLHVDMAGDFVLLSRENFYKLQGIPEEKEFHSAAFDSVFCFMMYAGGIPEEILTDPHRIYHIDHPSLWMTKPTRLQQFQQRSWMKRLQRSTMIPEPIRLGLSWLSWKLTHKPTPLDKMGIPYINWHRRGSRRIFEKLCTDLVNQKIPFTYNDQSWGLAQHLLCESKIAQAKWDGV